MIGLASLASLGLGVSLAAYAPRAGGRSATLESWGGAMLVAGLALLGAALPLFR